MKKLIGNLMKLQQEGTVEVNLSKDSSVASELLELQSVDAAPTADYLMDACNKPIPKLQIAILVVGTRGDVQPSLAMALRLQQYGHRVSLTSHSNFRGFVKSAGVEFYPLGGDPRVLAGYGTRGVWEQSCGWRYPVSVSNVKQPKSTFSSGKLQPYANTTGYDQ